jgi:mRNA interferase HigB
LAAPFLASTIGSLYENIAFVRVISKRAITEFVANHSDSSPSLEQWYAVVRKAGWHSLADVKQVYPHADLVGRRTVFNIAGNRYRLIARINYRVKAVFVLDILTHAEYDRGWWKQ